MFDSKTPSPLAINLDSYKDKVLGCWTGKNIGGTIGAPFEGMAEMNSVTFYTQDLGGAPAPNDDLDLQLVWLQAIEEHGIYHITPRLLGEYWMNCVSGPCNEYSVCKANIANGLYPPLSGSTSNDKWKWSNGAWIRSEIWACPVPGSPDEAAEFASIDACCDHEGEGVYAEIFTASMQSAAFIVSDIQKLIEIGLSKIPSGCRIARAVKLARSAHSGKASFEDARNAIVKDSEDLGFFQAPANIGFVVLGLLYGEGDFAKSVCLACNCGDDTDCTAATVGALLGIVNGRSGIPANWIEPIGESIKTAVLNTFDMEVPKTLGELTARVVRQALMTQMENPLLIRIAPEATHVSPECLSSLTSSKAVEKRLWGKSPYELAVELPFGELGVDYEGGPCCLPGESKTLKITARNSKFTERIVMVEFKLPEGWSAEPANAVVLNCIKFSQTSAQIKITAGPMPTPIVHAQLAIRLAGRLSPFIASLPFQTRGSVEFNHNGYFMPALDEKDRHLARMKQAMQS